MSKDRPYVGQSRRLDADGNPTTRWKRHIADAKNPAYPIHRAIAKYGIQEMRVLEHVSCDGSDGLISSDDEDSVSIDALSELLNAAETKWVEKLNSMVPEKGGIGYNLAPPGGAFPHDPHTEEHKAYMSALMSGRILSDETKEKLRIARTGVPILEATKEKHRANAKQRYDEHIFPEGLIHFLKWREDNSGEFPRCSNNKDCLPEDEHKASSWYWCVVRKYNADQLSEDQLTQLNALEREGKWRWRAPDTFTEQVEHYKAQHIKWKGVIRRNTPLSKDADRHKAMLWLTRMRELYRKNDTSHLTHERRTTLECLRDEGLLTL
jgi:hypothetical protein